MSESMTKIKTTLTIEKEVLEKAKKHLPNISAFVEECLKQYIGLADGIYPTADAQEIVDEIGKLQAKLFILNQNFDLEEGMRQIEQEKLNRPWRFLWNDYKRKLTINPQLMREASNALGVDEDTLEDILDFVYVNQDQFSFELTWTEVYNEYRKEEVE